MKTSTAPTGTFTLNGKTYRSDAETQNVLRELIWSAKANKDSSAVQAVMALGLHTGRIVEVA
jgi:hypothetical protein